MTMAETTTTAVASTAITMAGLATGLPPELILPAFSGALWSIRGARKGGVLGRVWQVATGTLFGAWASQSAAAFVTGIWPALQTASGIKYPTAFAVGFMGLRLLEAWGARREREEMS